MLGNSGAFTYSPGGFSPEDFNLHRRAAGGQHDELKPSPLQRNGVFRPSSRVIYMQRKEYSETLNQPGETFQVRVEHLFTSELDGRDVKTLNDSVAKLKLLDAKGRLWPQDMIMDVQGGTLLLSDIETKTELESLPLSSIVQTKAILDSCAYNSLLTVSVRQRNKVQVFMFQCEEPGAKVVKADLDKLIRQAGSHVDPPGVRANLENVARQQSFRSGQPERILADEPPPPWSSREREYSPLPRSFTPQDDYGMYPEQRGSPDMSSPGKLDAVRNADILNHVIDDIEIFMAKVAAAGQRPSSQDGKSKKKNKKSKKNAIPLPQWEEYASCLQKIKYGFNLLGQLEGALSSPSAPEFVHIFFTSLEKIVFQYPAEIPPSVVSPLLTEAAVELMEKVVGPEENQLWRSLGESWNVPRSLWPDSNVPPYIPQFYSGWQPPAPTYHPPSYSNGQSGPNNGFPGDGRRSGGPQWQQDEPDHNGSWDPAPPPPPAEPPLFMRAMYDFVARNNRELSIMTGEEVKVIQRSKQWWLVQNSRGEEGNVPQNVLEHIGGGGGPSGDSSRDPRGAVTLDRSSSPGEVKAWLRHRGFSNITVSSLGVLSGSQLLGMSKDEIRTVCPEEGGRVFFQLQAVKSAIALASESSGMYNGRY